jgi:hypothetical protein
VSPLLFGRLVGRGVLCSRCPTPGAALVVSGQERATLRAIVTFVFNHDIPPRGSHATPPHVKSSQNIVEGAGHASLQNGVKAQ